MGQSSVPQYALLVSGKSETDSDWETGFMTEKIWVCDDEPSTRFPVYTRGNVGEVWAQAVTPLTWTTFGLLGWEVGFREALYEMGVFTADEFRPIGQGDVIGCFGGYVYINVSVNRVIGVRIPGMTPEAIDASFFGESSDAPPYRADPRDENAERSKQVSAWLASLANRDPKAETDADRSHLEARLARRPDFAALTDAAILQYLRALIVDARRLLKRHVLNLHGSNVLTGTIAQLSRTVGAGEFAASVTAGVGDVDSAGPSYDLWKLSRHVKSSPSVASEFDRGIDGLLDRLHASDDVDARIFLEQWRGFIDRWGFLGPDVWEFRSRSYRTDPEMALRMLDRTRLAADSSAPDARTASLAADRDAAIAKIAARLSDNAAARDQFVMAARTAGNYLAARERSKILNARLNDEARTLLRELGARLLRRGLVSRWEDVLMVTNDEADEFIANPAAFSGLIAQRWELLDLLISKEPPFVFEAKLPPLSAFRDRANSEAHHAPMAGKQLTGIGVSPGRHTGRARVITSLDEDSDLEPGEVIIAATTDSTWGPLFLVAGAIVVETGSTISHAAIVSRELGIPAVASVENAAQRIRNGDTVTVDGNAGTVTIETATTA
jgi:phosphohistidine swiveling domain-containing protein